MNRIFSVVAVVAVGLSIMGMGVGLGPVAGQEAPTSTPTNETATPTATATATTTATTRATTTPTTAPTSSAPTDSTPTATDSPRDMEDRARDLLNQTRDALNQTATPTPTDSPRSQATPTETPTPERNSSYLPGEALDEQTSLSNWRFEDGKFILTFEYLGERPRTVTLSESAQGARGTLRFATRDERLLPGTNTITMTTMIQGGESAVSMTTAQSREQGYGIAISTGQQGQDPFAPYGGTSGVLSGVGISVLLSGGAAGWVIWREESGVIEA